MTIPMPMLIALILVGLVVLSVFIIGLSKRWGILVPYGAMLLFASMSIPLDWHDHILPTFWLQIQLRRSPLFLASGIAGMIVVLVQSHRLRGKGHSISVWLLVIAGIYASLLRFVQEGPAEGASSLVFSICTLIPLMLVVPIVVDEAKDFVLILRTCAVVSAVWTGMTLVQIAVNPRFVTFGNESRFVGILSNPQHTGVILAFMCIVLLWLLLNDRRTLKPIYIILLGFNAIFLIWTGSRTGLGMTLIGISAVMYTRVGRAIFFLPIVAIITYFGIKFVIHTVGIDMEVNRMTSMEDTRSAAWRILLTQAMENPLIGVGTSESERSENSWLYGFATYGIGMLSLLIMMAVVVFGESIQSLRIRLGLHNEAGLIMDLSLGLVGMYMAGALLEGYMISRVSAMLCVYPIAAGVGAVLRKQHRNGLLYEEQGLEHSGWEGYDEEDYTEHTEHGDEAGAYS